MVIFHGTRTTAATIAALSYLIATTVFGGCHDYDGRHNSAAVGTVVGVDAYSLLSSNTNKAHRRTTESSSSSSSVSKPIDRRTLLQESISAVAVSAAVASSSAAVTTINPGRVNAAAAESVTPLAKYDDPSCKFSIDLPTEWTKSEQTLPDRRRITLYIKPDSNQRTLIFIAYTPVRDDYTSLSSFGSVDEVGQATILPKGELAGVAGIDSSMVSAVSKKNAYYFDYTQKTPDQPQTHFRTIFTLATGATGGAGNVLVTITAQTPESDYPSMKPLFDQILDSYK
jgi:hypothetical protein